MSRQKLKLVDSDGDVDGQNLDEFPSVPFSHEHGKLVTDGKPVLHEFLVLPGNSFAFRL